MIKRLRIKFICINMLIVTIMLGIIFAMVLHFTQNSMKMEGMRMMQMASDDRGRGPGPRNPHLVVQLDRQGNVLGIEGDSLSLSEAEQRQIIAFALEREEPFGELSQFDLRYFRRHMQDGERLVFADTSVERNMLANLVRDCLVIGGISLLAFFFISLLLARWAVKPVEQAWIRQRQFVADASHELKTPLTVILTNAELLQSDTYTPQQKAGFSQSILTMSHQMRGLVEHLLELAKVDAGRISITKTPVALTQIAAEAALSFEVLFYEKGLQLQTDLEEEIFVLGSGGHLRQVVEILLDNALKYSQPGKTLVTLSRSSHAAVLSVSNPGAPIGEEDLRNIFKRFYRVDPARSMNHSYGLGLSIAQGIVAEHGGKIKAESKNGMNTFTVTVPLIKK